MKLVKGPELEINLTNDGMLWKMSDRDVMYSLFVVNGLKHANHWYGPLRESKHQDVIVLSLRAKAYM